MPRTSVKQSSKKRKLTIPEKHQLRIARRTLKMADVFVHIMGGMTRQEAREIVRKLGGK